MKWKRILHVKFSCLILKGVECDIERVFAKRESSWLVRIHNPRTSFVRWSTYDVKEATSKYLIVWKIDIQEEGNNSKPM